MLEYERIDIWEGIDNNKTNKSKEFMLCHHCFFLDKNFSYGPYLCDGWYNIIKISIDFKNIAIVHVRERAYRIYFLDISKREAKKLMVNSNLIDNVMNLFFII